jgi:hypothetical protein
MLNTILLQRHEYHHYSYLYKPPWCLYVLAGWGE